jgi:hypothetical protein
VLAKHSLQRILRRVTVRGDLGFYLVPIPLSVGWLSGMRSNRAELWALRNAEFRRVFGGS